ncbi:MAG: hypothetical protein HYS23_12495 [Geobacter sp.]|nr:hypothetical protein [Geobacter sp.]
MRKSMYGVLMSVVIFMVMLVGAGVKAEAADVSVGVNVNIGPPPITIAAPPAVVLMPSIGVYFVPGLEFDVFFYNGYWWSPRGGVWYRAKGYNGPWGVVNKRYVPGPVVRVPGDYRTKFANERHVPYKEWKEKGGHGGKGGRMEKHMEKGPMDKGGHMEKGGGMEKMFEKGGGKGMKGPGKEFKGGHGKD